MRYFIIAAPLVLLLASLVSATGLGIGPVKTTIETVGRGQEIEYYLFVYSSFNREVTLSIYAQGNCSDWVSIYLPEDKETPISSIALPPMSSKKLLVKVRVPENAPAGEYVCKIYAQQQVEGSKGYQTLALKVGSELHLTVKGEELPKGEVRGIMINNPKPGEPLVIEVTIENTGNVVATPLIEIEITKDGKTIDKFSYSNTSISPGEKKNVRIERSTKGWSMGEYYAKIKVYITDLIYERDDLLFRITEEGGTNIYKEKPTGMVTFSKTYAVGIIVVVIILIGVAILIKRSQEPTWKRRLKKWRK